MPSLITTAPATLTRLPTLRLEPNRIINGIFYQYIDNRGGWLIHESKNPAPTDHDYLGLGTRRGRQRFVDGRPEIIAEIPDGFGSRWRASRMTSSSSATCRRRTSTTPGILPT